MSLLREIAVSLWSDFRETLPSDEREAGPFLAGMIWAFVTFWTVLIVVTVMARP